MGRTRKRRQTTLRPKQLRKFEVFNNCFVFRNCGDALVLLPMKELWNAIQKTIVTCVTLSSESRWNMKWTRAVCEPKHLRPRCETMIFGALENNCGRSGFKTRRCFKYDTNCRIRCNMHVLSWTKKKKKKKTERHTYTQALWM